MKPQVEQELAHVLLTELLAYQFASPVRWIETQDVIFAEKKAELVVEIGPSETLAGMAQRTLKANYQSFDAALSLHREILTYQKNSKQIYYEHDEEPAVEQKPELQQDTAPEPFVSIPAAAASTAAAAAPTGPVAVIDDAPLLPMDILLCIIAHKLKKQLEEIPPTKAIKDLVGGKSTVQNEILGDLAKEFSSAPEKAEELPLAELADSLGDSFQGKLGKHTTALVSKLVSAKMPGGFGMTALRSYLQARWGLPQGRQDGALLVALTREPAKRLASDTEAKKFLDDSVKTYASRAKLDLTQASSGISGSAANGAGQATVSAEALEAVTKDQKYLARQQLEQLARYLKVDLRSGHKKEVAQREATEVLQKELDMWLSEHGDIYAQGITPVFSPAKSRIYDSYWNWARQDCFKMFFDIIWCRLDSVDREVVARCIAIMNRTNPTLIEMMVHYIDHVPTERGPTFALASDMASQLMENCIEFMGHDPVYKDVQVPTAPRTVVNDKGSIEYDEVPRPACRKLEQYVFEMAQGNEITRDLNSADSQLQRLYESIDVKDDIKEAYELLRSRLNKEELPVKGMRPDIVPFLHLKKRVNDSWTYDRAMTGEYLSVLETGARDGLTYANKMVLLIGAGRGSIGVKILEGLLSGGAKVVVTTSAFSKEITDFYQSIYTRFGSAGSTLVVVPFNQASKTDVKALISYVYNKKDGLGWDLDFVIPFAAIPEGGIEIDGIDSKSELAHRLMLTNVLRLLGEIKSRKAENQTVTRPAQVILPLSPNHGTFGGDGLYGESKISLETLFNRWHSESWSSYLTICGAVIGWTRGTGLMSQNNLVAEGVESLGVRTFSQQEMAFNILGLLTPPIVNLCQKAPVWADLNGGMQNIEGLKGHMANLRKELLDTAELRRAVAIETGIEQKVVNGPLADGPYKKELVKPRSNLKFEFPELKDFKDLPAKELQGMIDLDKVAVVTGFSEIGPWGNSRTRWEIEKDGCFSLEGAIEIAWIMGLIKYQNAPIQGKPYSGWVDSKTGEPVEEFDIKTKYESYILEHSGVRLVEPEIVGYDPHKKQLMQEVIIEQDLEPFEASKESADQFKLEQGDKVETFPIPDSEEWTVRFLRGSRILVPKALQYNRFVAGQVPTGWDARRYGVPDDICQQVDRITLYALVSTAEALLSAGITDPYEFYKYVHVSEVANASGSGMGGMGALRQIFKERYLDQTVQNDILQESFINTMSAWVNMLLVSSSGPIRTPVGACATAVESVDCGVELIQSGTAKIVIVGGYDDLKEEGIFEFGSMNATSNSATENDQGRTPQEMSRPTTTTRAGFMEAHGAGIQILMSGRLAVEMGMPIYGIIALSATASDKIGRSVPAPGKGIMTVARETPSSTPSPLLDIQYRKRQLEYRRKQIRQWVMDEEQLLNGLEGDSLVERLKQIAMDAERQEKEALATWGSNFYKQDPRIAPLRGALAQWGLTIEDIGVSSFHGTSTKANDKNESAAIHDMLTHLGRTKGNPVLGIFQKYLTGHPKGAAGAWMLNGVLQSLNSGYVPGNRNADNVDPVLRSYDRLVFPSITLHTYGIKAATVTSFGFGQKGGFLLVIHPDYFFSSLDEQTYESYRTRTDSRYKKVYSYLHDAICTNSLFKAKDSAPYTAEQEIKVYLEPQARVNESYKYSQNLGVVEEDQLQIMMSTLPASGSVGVDVELLSSVNIDNKTFLERNFTKSERDYCDSAPDVRASYTGTWSAKEAVFKSLNTESKGAGAPLIDIEIVRGKTGPQVKLSGEAAKVAAGRHVSVSISHSELQAVAVAITSSE